LPNEFHLPSSPPDSTRIEEGIEIIADTELEPVFHIVPRKLNKDQHMQHLKKISTKNFNYPLTSIGLLTIKIGHRVVYGTGFLIGPNHVLTSAYNVFDYETGTSAKKVYFSPGYNNKHCPFGSFRAGIVLLQERLIPEQCQGGIALLVLQTSIGYKTG